MRGEKYLYPHGLNASVRHSVMKHAIRQLAKNPGFTVTALLTLALSIGVNTTAFTVLNRLMLQSLPFREPARLVRIWASNAQYSYIDQTPGDYCDERDHNSVFEAIASYVPGFQQSLVEPGQPPMRYSACSASANFFPLFGIQAQLGRLFTAEEENRSEPLVVISNLFWREHYNADPKILGRTVKLNSKMFTIVGVLTPAMDEPTLFNGAAAFWMLDNPGVNRTLRDYGWYTVAARLKPGVTIEQAQAEMTALATNLERDNPKTNKSRGLKVEPYPSSTMLGTGAQLTWLVLALSGMVLLIGCANLANLQLVRTMRRSHEIGVRIALGCPRSTLIWMLLTESLLVSVAGGALGLLVAKWSNNYVASFFELTMPLDWRVLGFAFIASLLTGAVFGTVPAWIASRTDVNASLKSSGRGMTADRSRHWLRQTLVVVELALALTLLAGAAFFVNGIYKLTHRDLGWSPGQMLVGSIELDHDHYGEIKDPRSVVFGERMVRELEALPGVEGVTLGDSPSRGFGGGPIRIEGQPAPEPGKEIFAGTGLSSPGFFKVYGVRLMQGRDFRESDRLGAPEVVIINEAMAQKFWPGENPIGKRIGRTDPAAPAWEEVVGVMSDFEGAMEFYDPTHNKLKVLLPWAQNNHRFINFSVRTSVNADAFKETFRKALGLLAPDIAPSMLASVKDAMAGGVAYFTFLRRILLQISVLGLVLAAVGIYGVVSNLTSERTNEIGIRMALGAQPGDIVWLFLRNGIQLALVGAVVGVGAAYILLNVLAKMLPMVPGTNHAVVGIVAVILVLIAVIASWLPARRTTKVSPTVALRSE